MSAVDTAVQRAVALLKASGAVFEVRMPDGTVHGGLPKPDEVKRTRKMKRPMGEGFRRFGPFIEDLQPGGVAKIVVPEDYTVNEVQCWLTARANNKWGKGNYVSARVDNDTAVELLRVS